MPPRSSSATSPRVLERARRRLSFLRAYLGDHRLGIWLRAHRADSDPEVVADAYWWLLGRGPDQSGLELYAGQLRSGRSRRAVVASVAASDEHRQRSRARGGSDRPGTAADRPPRVGLVKAGRVRSSGERRRFLLEAHRALLGERPTNAELALQLEMLQAGRTKGEMLVELARRPQHRDRAIAPLRLHTGSAEQFVADAYRHLLGREPDRIGLRYFVGRLQAGASRHDVASGLAESDEHVNRVTAAVFRLPNLRARHPADYRSVPTIDGSETLTVFACTSAADLDRLERAILDNGYYEKPGIWSFELNADKRIIAEMVAALEPDRVLEIGCSNGTVLQCLAARGIPAEGIEISRSAIARADPSVRGAIHLGDLLDVQLTGRYGVICGFDVFEHLNPNRLHAYLDRVVSLLAPGGFVLANLPAFGEDPVFGTVFPLSVPSWAADVAAGRPFSLLPVDPEGYPHHGHLIWAGTRWWVTQFERAGLRRQPELELPLHERYDEFFAETGPARRSFFVFSCEASGERIATLAGRIRGTQSAELARGSAG